MCVAGTADCGNGCEDITENPLHCGSCGNACDPTTEVCVSRQCQCAPGLTECPPNGCLDLQNAAIAGRYRSSARASTGARGRAAWAGAPRARAEGRWRRLRAHRCQAPHQAGAWAGGVAASSQAVLTAASAWRATVSRLQARTDACTYAW